MVKQTNMCFLAIIRRAFWSISISTDGSGNRIKMRRAMVDGVSDEYRQKGLLGGGLTVCIW